MTSAVRTARAASRLHDAVLRALSRGRCLDLAALFSIVDQLLGDNAQTWAPNLDREKLCAWLCDHPDLVDATPHGWMLRAGVVPPVADGSPRKANPPKPRARCGYPRRGGVLRSLAVLGEATVAELAEHLGVAAESVYMQIRVHRRKLDWRPYAVEGSRRPAKCWRLLAPPLSTSSAKDCPHVDHTA